jgi:hypothetical protein
MGVGGGWLTPRPGRLHPGKRNGTHCIGGWVGTSTDKHGCRKFRLHRDSIPRIVQPVASQYTDYSNYNLNIYFFLYMKHEKKTD